MQTELIEPPAPLPLRIIDETGLPDLDRSSIELFVREQVAAMRAPPASTVIVMQVPQRDRATFRLLLSWNLIQAAVVIGVGVWAYMTLTAAANAIMNAPANVASSVYQHVPAWLGGPSDSPRR